MAGGRWVTPPHGKYQLLYSDEEAGHHLDIITRLISFWFLYSLSPSHQNVNYPCLTLSRQARTSNLDSQFFKSNQTQLIAISTFLSISFIYYIRLPSACYDWDACLSCSTDIPGLVSRILSCSPDIHGLVSKILSWSPDIADPSSVEACRIIWLWEL